MSERARRYFNTFSPPLEPRYFNAFGYLFSVNWAKECWTTITDKEKEITNYFQICKIRDMNEVVLYEVVIGKLLIVWGSNK